MHFHQPDSIFTGVLKGLGWEDRAHVDHSTGCYAHYLVNLPEMTLEALCHHLMHAIGMNGLRYIGKPDMPVRTVALVGHLFPEDHGLKHPGRLSGRIQRTGHQSPGGAGGCHHSRRSH